MTASLAKASEGPPADWRPPYLVAPIRLGSEKDCGNTWVRPAAGADEFLIERAPVVRCVSGIVRPEILKALGSEAGETLRWSRVLYLLPQSTWNEEELSLELQVGSSDRILRDVALSNSPTLTSTAPIVGPAPWSAYLNARTFQSFGDSSSGKYDRNPFESQLDGAIQVQETVLEGGGIFTEGAAVPFARSELRLVRDWEEKRLRFALGETPSPIGAFQRSRSLGGLSLSKTFQIDPYSTIRPQNRSTVILRRPSVVEVWVNGGMVQRLNLPAGPFDLREFPLTQGANAVDLIIRDDSGAVEKQTIYLLYDDRLIGEGVEFFHFQSGVPYLRDASGISYDDPTLSSVLQYQRGVSDRWNVGGRLDHHGTDEGHFEITNLSLTPWGLFGVDGAVSNRNGGTGTAARVHFRSLERRSGRIRPVLLQWTSEFRSRLYAPTEETAGNLIWSHRPSLLAMLGPSLRLNLSPSLSRVRDQRTLSKELFVDSTVLLRPGLHLTLQASRAFSPTPENRIAFTLNFFESPRSQWLGSYESQSQRSRVEWASQPDRPQQKSRYLTGVDSTGGDLGGDAQIDHLAEHFSASISHRTQDLGTGSQANHTQLRAGFALVALPGAVSVSRPIGDSFALFRLSPGSKGKIPINPRENESETEARSGFLGDAVLPDLVSYYRYDASLSPKHLDPGKRIAGPENFRLRPTYRSGLLVPIAVQSAAFVEGHIQSEGKDHALQVIVLEKRIEGRWVRAEESFTSRRGRFVIESLSAGDYRIRSEDQRRTTGVFVVAPESAEQSFELQMRESEE